MSGACAKPTRLYPQGRAGTAAGATAHRRAGEQLCEACARAEVERVAAYDRRHKAKVNERSRRYAKTEKGRESNRRKKARRRAREVGEGVLVPAGRICVCCRSHDRIEVDHIVPISKGGSPTHPSNQQWLCRRCNASKSDGDTCRLHGRFLGTRRRVRL